MYETRDQRLRLQKLLDDSYSQAGDHLRSIVTPEWRLTADQVIRLLRDVNVLTLATVTADGRPRVGPVDGLFFQGSFWFGSSPDSVRFRHIRRRPDVSAAHTRDEQLAVIVHGRAVRVDTSAREHRRFRDYLVEIYGEDWFHWGAGAAYARIEAERMFAFSSTFPEQ